MIYCALDCQEYKCPQCIIIGRSPTRSCSSRCQDYNHESIWLTWSHFYNRQKVWLMPLPAWSPGTGKYTFTIIIIITPRPLSMILLLISLQSTNAISNTHVGSCLTSLKELDTIQVCLNPPRSNKVSVQEHEASTALVLWLTYPFWIWKPNCSSLFLHQIPC